MRLIVKRSAGLSGKVVAPPSKSHTHRAVAVASLAGGDSVIENPLVCGDCSATLEACRKFGATTDCGKALRIRGVGGTPRASETAIDAGNSGTTLRFMTAIASLCDGTTVLTGDDSVKSRPIGPLLRSLSDLGAAKAESVGGNGCPPVAVTGKIKGGKTTVEGTSSQFVSALLIACPLAKGDTEIGAVRLNSRPYVAMTLEHLKRAGAEVFREGDDRFRMRGGQSYKPFRYSVPGDQSAAAFLKAASRVTESSVEIAGLDPNDSQGDAMLDGFIELLDGGDMRRFDLRDCPDLLPVMAVLGCHAAGETILANAPHARAKESDRISAVCTELRKMGADIEERPDGLVARGSRLSGTEVDGHGDHRIVMALTVAGLVAGGRTVINGAESISVSYPGFIGDLASLGADVRTVS